MKGDIMLKQIITALLIPCLFLYLTGCYTMSEIPKEEITPKTQDSNIQVVTNDGESYLFKAFEFKIKNDTLFGLAAKPMSGSPKIVQTSIPLKDIFVFKSERANGGLTILAILSVVAVAFLIYTLIVAHALAEGLSEIGHSH
jgi:hypothetical protein